MEDKAVTNPEAMSREERREYVKETPFEYRVNVPRAKRIYKAATVPGRSVYRTHLKLAAGRYLEYIQNLPEDKKEQVTTGGKSMYRRGPDGEFVVRVPVYEKMMRKARKGDFRLFPGMMMNCILSELEHLLAVRCPEIRKIMEGPKETGVKKPMGALGHLEEE